MTRRRRQGEKAGYYTDADGYKLHDARRPHHSHRPSFGDHPSESDVAIIERAIRERWLVTRRTEKEVFKHLRQLLDSDPTTALRVVRVVIAAERQRQKERAAGKLPVKKITLEDLLARPEPKMPDPEEIRRRQELAMQRDRGSDNS